MTTTRRPAAAIALVIAACLLATATGQAASSNVVVSMEVPSATSINVAACTSLPAAISFGTVLPGTASTTTADCNVTFGSSNDTSSLRLSQVDGRDAAMYRPFDGATDTGFGTAGLLTLDNTAGTEVFWSSDQLADGDIILAGRSEVIAGDEHLLLMRTSPSGVPRASFGTGGVQTYNLNPAGGELGWTVQALADGSILVGAGRPGGSGVARFLGTGARDMAWGGGDGWAETTFEHLPRNIATDRSGRVYVAGTSYWPVTNCVVSRFSSAGVLDTTYGSSGSVSIGPADSNCDGMDIDSRGRVVIAGVYHPGAEGLLVRLTASGAVDQTFNGGRFIGDVAGATTTEFFHLEVAPDDSVIVGGRADGRLLLARYTAAGAPMTSFNGTGVLRHPTITWGVRDIAWLDGRVVVVGDYGNARIARFNVDGSDDLTFSSDGVDDPALPVSTEDNGLLLMGDGRALLHGGNGSRAEAFMYRAASIPDHAGGSADWNDGQGFFGACLRSVSATGDPAWTPNAACTASDGAWWNDVPQAPETIATSDANEAATVASVRFALRVPSAQSTGAYVAPLRFEVIAPAA